MSSKRYVLIVLFWLASSPLAWSNVDNLFDQANKLYDQSEFEEAYRLYDSIERLNYQSAELYLNKGNCAYKMGWTALSVLNFEKALRINPGFDDALHNLMLANELVKDKRNDIRSANILNWISAFFNGNYSALANVALVLFLFVGFFISWHLLKKPAHKWWIRTSILFSLSAIVMLSLALLINWNRQQSKGGIIMEPVITIYNEPSENSSAAFILHEGSKVEIIEEIEHWYKISFDSKQGWLQKSSTATI
jgi:tetratricopeptide (TPR) repeat protein